MGVGHKLSCEKGYKFDFCIIYSWKKMIKLKYD